MGVYKVTHGGKYEAYKAMAAGSASGFITRFLCQPLDVLKIRFQLQIEPISRKSSASRYQSLLQACADIWRREGITGFWKGHIPAQFLSVIYGCTQFLSYDRIYLGLRAISGGKYDTLMRALSGGCAGCVGTLVSYPTDILRTRFSSQGEHKVYRSLKEAVTLIAKNEGYRGFFKGLQPTLIQIFPYVSLQFGLYKPFVDLVKLASHSGRTDGDLSTIESMVAGGLSGGVAKTAVYPFDLVKRRLQVQGFEQARRDFGRLEIYHGSVDCIKKTLVNEGVRGLFKGMCPSLVKAVCVSALSFSVYELCYKAMSL